MKSAHGGKCAAAQELAIFREARSGGRARTRFSTTLAHRAAPPDRVVDNKEKANSIKRLVFAEAVGKLFDARYSRGASTAGD